MIPLAVVVTFAFGSSAGRAWALTQDQGEAIASQCQAAARALSGQVGSMLIGMLDMTRGVMLPRWPWKIMHTRGESILPISGPKVSGGNWWPRLGSSTAFSPLFGENSLKHEDQEKISGVAVDGQRSIHLI